MNTIVRVPYFSLYKLKMIQSPDRGLTRTSALESSAYAALRHMIFFRPKKQTVIWNDDTFIILAPFNVTHKTNYKKHHWKEPELSGPKSMIQTMPANEVQHTDNDQTPWPISPASLLKICPMV